MKLSLSLRIFQILFLFAGILLIGLLRSSGPALAQSGPSPQITLRASAPVVEGHPIYLRIHVSPSPSHRHPLHLHLYVDGRMMLMFTAVQSKTGVTIPPLHAGKHEVKIVEADMKTHQEMGHMEGMEGMDMRDMGAMPHGVPTKGAALAHLLLKVIKESR